MRLRYRILLVFAALTGGGSYYLVDWFAKELRPRYLEAFEETLIDAANLSAEWIEAGWQAGEFPRAEFAKAFHQLYARRLTAKIFTIPKTQVDLRIYVTDTAGIVLFDSDGGRSEGLDFSQWRDVYLTLRGSYGARSSLRDPDDPNSSELYVAAPIFRSGQTIGVVTVCKPKKSIDLFLEIARNKAKWAGLWVALVGGVTGFVLILWLMSPLKNLIEYALRRRDGKPAEAPRHLPGEMKELFHAYEQMRLTLEGKQYAEQYVQSLTHALKSPLAAMQGAVELLQENPPDAARQKFLSNLSAEAARMRETVDRLLSLAQLETRRDLGETSLVDMVSLMQDVIDDLHPQLESKSLIVDMIAQGSVRGDRLLLRTAWMNLLENAIDFSLQGGRLTIRAASESAGTWRAILEDEGPGIPAYALARIGERFFSLPRPDTGRKGTGLGISWIKEVTRLHGGTLDFTNRPQRGLRVEWVLPSA
jgi:two-component system, OmpR family, sensor histidine kinase CreC